MKRILTLSEHQTFLIMEEWFLYRYFFLTEVTEAKNNVLPFFHLKYNVNVYK